MGARQGSTQLWPQHVALTVGWNDRVRVPSRWVFPEALITDMQGRKGCYWFVTPFSLYWFSLGMGARPLNILSSENSAHLLSGMPHDHPSVRNTAAVHLLSIRAEHQTLTAHGGGRFSSGDSSIRSPAHSEPCAHPVRPVSSIPVLSQATGPLPQLALLICSPIRGPLTGQQACLGIFWIHVVSVSSNSRRTQGRVPCCADRSTAHPEALSEVCWEEAWLCGISFIAATKS